MLSVWIGYDKREPIAWDVCAYTLAEHASQPVFIQPLRIDKLKAQGLCTRQVTKKDGQMWDVTSSAPQSTEFAISRFLVPLMQQTGWAIFMDCDMIFLRDIYEILPLLDDTKAAMCVKHKHWPAEDTKMDNQIQTHYQRKNWSSVVAFNCDHPSNKKLTVGMINNMTGRDLHAFCWLTDDEIGELPNDWNWLVNVQDKPENPAIAHYTLGGPWFDGWEAQDHDQLWLDALEGMIRGRQ